MRRAVAAPAAAVVLLLGAGALTPPAAGGAALAATPTSTSLVLSHPASALGQAVRASATVVSASGPPQGDVVFTVDGVAVKANLTGGGTASILLPEASVGTHSVGATFVPQLPLQQEGSVAPALAWQVDRASVDLGLRVSGARPRSAARAHLDLRGDFGTRPTGAVRLRLLQAASPTRRMSTTRTATLDDTARATARLGRLGPGRYRLVATYPGDAGHEGARRAIRFRVR